MSEPHLPTGFVRFRVGTTDVVAHRHAADGFRAALAAGTLYKYAEQHPEARPLRGRGVVYAVPLPGDAESVVVRHNHHGGMFAAITRDVFPPPTRAPHELLTSERLRRRGVPTPAMLGYALYPAGPLLRRVDVVTREVRNAFDLSAAITSPDAELRTAALHATGRLVRRLSEAGARHRDLNVKNVLLAEDGDGALRALVLDVDRVAFPEDRTNILTLNLARLFRSARKWRDEHGAKVTESELRELARAARAQPASARTRS